MQPLGLVHIYTGEGKGKTTASLGLAFRAAGHGLKVSVVQFLKGGGYCGEFLASKLMPTMEIKQFGQDCPWSKELKKGNLKCGSCRFCFSVYKEDKVRSENALKHAAELVASGKHDVVVLDEVNSAVKLGLISSADVVNVIKSKPAHMELVLTGRNAPKEIIELADYVTEMKDVKHPMKSGVNARKGIEY